MRFLLKEQPYEKFIASGSLRYEYDGRPTGLLEHWRYTAAFDGYHFLRVDLDGRQSSGNTALYNLLLNKSGQPEQLKYRCYGTGWRMSGQLLFENGEVLAIHEQNERRTEQIFTDTGRFWFPTAAGFWLLSNINGTKLATTLNHEKNDSSTHGLVVSQVETAVKQRENALKISWNDHWCELTLDNNRFVKTLLKSNRLKAVSTRLKHYSP